MASESATAPTSALALASSLTQGQMQGAAMVALPTDCLPKGIETEQLDHLKLRIFLAREAADTAGNATKALAEHLIAIKRIAKKDGLWTKIRESGLLGISAENAKRLVNAYEQGVLDVPASCLANVSYTTLDIIARFRPKDAAETVRRDRAIAELVRSNGTGFTEKAARKILNPSKKAKAEENDSDMKDGETLDQYLVRLSGGKAQITHNSRAGAIKLATALKKENDELKAKLKEAGVAV